MADHSARTNLVVADSAHAAFHKAAHYFDLDIRSVATESDMRVDPDALVAMADAATAMVVVSAPQFAHGVVDPVADVGARTRAAGLWLHVDACMGGLTMPFLEGAPAFGFEVEGVDSISLDLHKYGYTPKGASIALYRSSDLRRYQYTSATRWTGYPLVNPTMQSTRSGGPLAAAWAIVELLGRDGYRTLAHQARTATTTVARFVEAHEHLAHTATPDATLLAMVTAPDAPTDVFGLAAEMRGKGWRMGPTPGFGSSPAHLHLTMTATHTRIVDELCADVDAAITSGGRTAPLLASTTDPAGLDPTDLRRLLDELDLVEDRAAIDATLDALPPDLRATAISATLERLFTP